MEDTYEIKDGEDIHYSSSGNGVIRYSSSGYQNSTHGSEERLAPRVKIPFIPKLHISKLQPSFYEYIVHFRGQEMYREVGSSSISEALFAVSDITGIDGYEVEYEGFVVGTYPISMFRDSTEKIARDAIATAAQFMQF